MRENGEFGRLSLYEDIKAFERSVLLSANLQIASQGREYYRLMHQGVKKSNMKYKYYTIYMAKVAYEGKLCLLMTVRDITD
mmetsp:Transcript_7487/g.5689  ORF Transcript_7487/g.5689 Transcript_7487/m.5689 type:complete len:81 (+) Transcript_7487:103-345(+)